MKNVTSLSPAVHTSKKFIRLPKVDYVATLFRLTKLMKKEHIEAKRENYANWEILDISLFEHFFSSCAAVRVCKYILTCRKICLSSGRDELKNISIEFISIFAILLKRNLRIKIFKRFGY